jgi:hypothetical protein
MFFNSKNVFLMDSKLNVVKIGSKDIVNGLYKFSIPHEVFCSLVVNTKTFVCTWHQCLGHLNVKNLHLFHKGLATNMPTIFDQSLFC